MFRQFFMVFHGNSRVDELVKAHIHESPPVMTIRLVILALGSIFAGWLGAPEYLWGSRWDQWLQPIFGGAHEAAHGSLAEELNLTLLTIAIGGLGFVLAYMAYARPSQLPDRLAALAGGGPYRLFLHKYYIDELYDLVIVRPFTRCSRWLAQIFDPEVIDGVVNGVARVAKGLSLVWRELQTGNVQHYLVGFLVGTLALITYFLGQQ
jgi:NADH-quinone oxidoreductase subunit L